MGRPKGSKHKKPYAYWTKEETKILKKNYLNFDDYELLNFLPNKTKNAITSKLRSLGLDRRWKQEEIDILKRHYPTVSKKEILSFLPRRSWIAIKSIAYKLNIKRENRERRESWEPILSRTIKINLKKSEKAWLACAIDCDGCIFLTNNSSKKDYCPILNFTNTKKEIVEYFKNVLKINKKIEINPRHKNHKAEYSIRITSMPLIYVILKQILPFFIIKKEQAKLTMEFIEIQDKKMIENKIIRYNTYTPRQHEIYNKFRELNKRGTD